MPKYSGKKVSVIIPFFNERNSIQKVIEQTGHFTDYIIAVDDGSTDNSDNLVSVNDKVILIKHETNLGKGAALKTGFIKSIELKTDYTVTIDADFQHPPELIPEFFKLLEKYDIVIGNRMRNKGKMPFQRIISNTLTSLLLTVKTGQQISDSQCGYRAYKTGIIPLILTMNSGYEAESEILVNAARKGLKIGFIDIPAVYSDEHSKMKPFEAISGFIKVLMS